MKVDLFVELNGEQADTAVLIDSAKETWKADGNRLKDIKTLQLYYKPDEKSCYYVINGESKGYFHI